MPSLRSLLWPTPGPQELEQAARDHEAVVAQAEALRLGRTLN
jgi:hypothetical protein